MKRVTLAYEYTDADDKTHEPDSTIELPVAEANRLLNAGLARQPDPDTKSRRKSGTDQEG